MKKFFWDYGFVVMVIFSPILFTGCVSFQDEPDNINVASEEIHKIIIGASPFFPDEGDTRVALNGEYANLTFEVGDKIGITIWEDARDAGTNFKHFITENAPFVCTKVYSDGTSEWSGTAKSSSDYANTSLHYTVYWPYNEKYSHSSCFTADDIRNKGLPDIPNDQSSPEKFKQALFCMGEGSMASGSEFLSATLKHERAAVRFRFNKITGRDSYGKYVSNVRLNSLLPCPINSSDDVYYYAIIPSSGNYTMAFAISGISSAIPDGTYVAKFFITEYKGVMKRIDICYNPDMKG